jgi:tyrosyl-tRNA synthetase
MNFKTVPDKIDLTPPKRIKFGIDPTYSRLHLGHLVPLRFIRKLKEQGHQITIVLGTFTAQLGDPSGRDATRPILDFQEVFNNANAIRGIVWDLIQPQSTVENHRHLDQIPLSTFLRHAAEFTLAHMMSRDGFREREANGQPIGLHELLYPVCQALDSLELNTEIEIGGQDQLFAFQLARQLQENHGFKPQDCILMPIINGTDGRKMSKSFGNCIWLDDNAYHIYGKVMSISDTTMTEWYPLLTDLQPLQHPMASKKQLAHDIATQLWGIDIASEAQRSFELTIQQGQAPEQIPVTHKLSLLPAVMEIRNCSKAEARRLVEQGAVTIDGLRTITECALQVGSVIKIGNRHFAKVDHDSPNSPMP